MGTRYIKLLTLGEGPAVAVFAASSIHFGKTELNLLRYHPVMQLS